MNFVQNGHLSKSGVHYFDLSLNPRRVSRITLQEHGKGRGTVKNSSQQR